MGVENFLVYAPDCVSLGLGLMERKDDPDVRKTCYLLFASLASVMKGEMAVHLPKIMDRMMLSLRSTDGVVVSDGIIISTLNYLFIIYDHYLLACLFFFI